VKFAIVESEKRSSLIALSRFSFLFFSSWFFDCLGFDQKKGERTKPEINSKIKEQKKG